MARKALVAAAAAAWGCGARPAVDWSLPQSPQLLKQYREVCYLIQVRSGIRQCILHSLILRFKIKYRFHCFRDSLFFKHNVLLTKNLVPLMKSCMLNIEKNLSLSKFRYDKLEKKLQTLKGRTLDSWARCRTHSGTRRARCQFSSPRRAVLHAGAVVSGAPPAHDSWGTTKRRCRCRVSALCIWFYYCPRETCSGDTTLFFYLFRWSNRFNNGMDSLVSSMTSLGFGGGMGLQGGEAGVWAPPGAGLLSAGPRLPPPPQPRDFNPWTARHPLQEFITPGKEAQWVSFFC